MAGSLPPPTPEAKLGTSKGTSWKRSKVSKDLPEGLGGGSGSGPPKNPGEAAGGGDMVTALIIPTVILVIMREIPRRSSHIRKATCEIHLCNDQGSEASR